MAIKCVRCMILMALAVLVGGGWIPSLNAAPRQEIHGAVLYVKPGAAGNCSSWAAACELQTALGLAAPGDQVRATAGTYKPTATTDRAISFILKSGVAVYGGFPAAGGDWAARDWRSNTTLLSGDIGTPALNTDNTYSVVCAFGVDSLAVLDGFTISGGYTANDGGGIYIEEASPTLMNLIISGNSADTGGGIYIENSASTLRNITFTNNSATFGGGALFSDSNSSALVMRDITVDGNESDYVGGGMVIYNSSPRLFNVTFSNNTAVSYGGGLDIYTGSPHLTNVTFSGNHAPTGGGLFSTQGSAGELLNATFSGNTATSGGGIYNFASTLTVTNAILWANTPDQIGSGGGSVQVVSYSDVQGGYAGLGNLNLNPSLAALADNGGLTLTQALTGGSPAIDAGNPASCPGTDQRGYFRPADGNGDGTARCDMGSYEYGSVVPFLVFIPEILR